MIIIATLAILAPAFDAVWVRDDANSNPASTTANKGICSLTNPDETEQSKSTRPIADTHYYNQCIGDNPDTQPSWGSYFTVLQGAPDDYKSHANSSFSDTIPASTQRDYYYPCTQYTGNERFNNTGTVTSGNPSMVERVRYWDAVTFTRNHSDHTIGGGGGN
jgi:hypothetical protein